MPHPTSLEELGRRLASLLDLIGGRQKASEIAERSPDQLWKYTKGAVEPPFLPLARLCYAADVRLDWLATGESPMRPEKGALGAASQAGRLDPATIVSALKLLSWAFELQGATYDPAVDPDLLADTYVFLVEHGGSVTPDNLVDFSKRLAEKRAKEADRATREQGAGGAVPGEGNPGAGSW